MIVCLFCIQSLENVLAPASGLPFVELVRQTVGPKGTIALSAFLNSTVWAKA